MAFDFLLRIFGLGDKIWKSDPIIEDEDGPIDSMNPFPRPVEIELGDVIDLHSIPPKQVRAVVEDFLEEAHHRGFRFVRIIHGKGIGVQREIVRKVLACTPFVASFEDAPIEAGGWGATVASLVVKDERS